MFPLNNINNVVTANNDQQYIRLLEMWAQKAQPGMGELRDTAVNRIKYCLERRYPLLDLSCLRLCTVLEILPKHIRCLNISNNQLHKLPNLFNYAFTELDVSHNYIKEIPKHHFPRNVETLNISYNKLEKLMNIPGSIRKIYARDNQIKELSNMFKYPNTNEIVECDLSNNLLGGEITYTISYAMKKLNLSNNVLTKVRLDRYFNLTELDISGNLITELGMLPNNLVKINAENNLITTTPYLPDSVTEINLYNNPLLTEQFAVENLLNMGSI